MMNLNRVRELWEEIKKETGDYVVMLAIGKDESAEEIASAAERWETKPPKHITLFGEFRRDG